MQPELARLLEADTNHAIEIADRVWWVGHVLEDDVFQCHVYLLEQGDQSVLFDPGSRLTFAGTLRKIEEVIPFSAIRWFVCHHQDPDITAALPLIDQLVSRDDAAILTHWRTQALLKHYGLRLPSILVDEHDWRLALPDRELRFIFTPYAHFPGAICSFDPHTGVLFSSDLFGGFTEQPRLVARDESHFEALRPFHEHYMPSSDILDYALAQIERYPVRMIAAQHGSIIPQHLVGFMIEKLKHLDCGIYLLGQEDTDIRRLSRLNATLREITETMLLYRDFRDIAARLLEVVQRSLPATRIDYFAAMPNGEILTLAQESRFIGIADHDAPAVCALIGKHRDIWVRAHRDDPTLAGHRIYRDAFCDQPDTNGARLITLPLTTHGSDLVTAIAVIHLSTAIPITGPVIELVMQIAEPLLVALEREVIYRTMDAERESAYQRSIRDSLTGLHTRFYMQDVIYRYCAVHDRNADAPVSAIMADIDHFKHINDDHGHLAGDRVLQQVGSILLENCRASDVPVRFGGEEFLLFLVSQDLHQARQSAERVRRLIAEHPFDIGTGTPLHVTASLGIAERHQREPLDTLIHRADEALYRAKQGGRNRIEAADTAVGSPAQPA